MLAVYPLQYSPQSGRLKFLTHVDFTLEMKFVGKQRIAAGMRSERSQEIYDQVLRRVVDNPGDISRYQVRPALGKISATQAVPFKSYEYVVITSEDLKPQFAALVSWKERKGWNAGIVTIDSIFAHYSTDIISGITDSAGAIRQYLSDCYYDGIPQTMWVLFGGDYSEIPIRYGCGSSDNIWDYYLGGGNYEIDGYKIPADLYFADFTGDWQVDGDIYYGQPHFTSGDSGDNPDYNPEIFVGRLLCSSSQDIQNWTAKLLKYELDPANSDPFEMDYLTNSFMMESDHMQTTGYWGTFAPPNDQANLVASHLSMFTHTIWREVPSGDDSSPTSLFANAIISEMNNHYGLYSWFSHGEPNHVNAKTSGLNAGPGGRYAINTVDNIENYEVTENNDGLDCLTNNDYPAILYSTSCNNTPFDDHKIADYPGRNLGEGFTVITKAGGPAFLGNTRFGWVGSSYQLYQHFADSISFRGQYHLGVAEAKSKVSFSDHYLKYSHNLVGCPETEIWTDTPSLFTNASVTYNSISVTVNTGGVGNCDICACSGDNGALYHEVAHNVSSYVFNTSVRPLYITITRHDYIPYTAVTGGTFASNEIWFGNLIVLGSVVMDNNKTLTVLPGTNVKFNGNFSLYLKAGTKIVAKGVSNDSIFFTSDNHSRQAWKNLYVYSSNDSLEYCTFEYGNWAVNFYGYPSHSTGNVVRNCIFRNNDQGLRIENSDVEVYDCLLENNRHAFVITNAGSQNNGIYLYGNTARNNERDGIYCYHSTLDLFHNKLENNGTGNTDTYHGIWAFSLSDVALGGRDWVEEDYDQTAGYNEINDNHGAGVYVSANSVALLGDCQLNTPEDFYMATHNSIYGNGTYGGTYSGKQVYNANTSKTVKARKNYWGGTPIASQFYGSVDYSYYLSDPPQPQILPVSSNNKVAAGMRLGRLNGNPAARDTEMKQSRIAELRQLINNYPNSPAAVEALQEIYHYVRGDYNNRLGERSGIFGYLNGIYLAHPDLDLGKLALQLLVNERMQAQDLVKAVQLAEEGIKILKGEDKEGMMATLILFYIQQDRLANAQDLFAQFKSTYCNDKNLQELLSTSIANAPQNTMGKVGDAKIALLNSSVSPNQYGLQQNYPNPFNPVTTIEYELAEDTNVSLVIYDLCGREIARIVNEKEKTGFHSVNWNAANLPSGVYFYRMRAGNFVAIHKLLLLK